MLQSLVPPVFSFHRLLSVSLSLSLYFRTCSPVSALDVPSKHPRCWEWAAAAATPTLPLGTLTPSSFSPASLPSFLCVFRPELLQKVLLFSSTIDALRVFGVAGAEQYPSHPTCGHRQGLKISLSSRRVKFLPRQLFLLHPLTKEVGFVFIPQFMGN